MEAPSGTVAHPHLRHLLSEAEAVRAETKQLRDTLTDTQLTWRPEPAVWSVADCFEHLRKVDKAYSRSLTAAIDTMETGAAPYAPSWFARLFIRFVSPESKFKVKTLRAINPAAGAPADPEAPTRFLAQQAGVMDLIRRADGKNLNTGKFSSPLASIVRFTVGEGLTMLVMHERRHLVQAQRVTTHPDFPSAEA